MSLCNINNIKGAEMKITYKFVSELIALLQNADWGRSLIVTLKNIDERLKLLPEEAQNNIKAKQSRWAELESAGRIVPDAAQQKKIKSKIESSYDSIKSDLILEKADIEKCLEAGEYRLGSGVFENIENAKLLLANVHFLEAKEFGFNKVAVDAVKKMLHSNYGQLYNEAVQLAIPGVPPSAMDSSMIDKILSGNFNKIEDLFEHYNEAPEQYREGMDAMFRSVSKLDRGLVKYSYDKLKPFEYFFSIGMSHMAISLSVYFGYPKDVDKFLSKVDFSSYESAENDIELLEGSLDLSVLSPGEMDIWHELNAEIGAPAIKLFGQANDLQKLFNISQAKIIADYAADEQRSVADILFQMVQNHSEQILFARADEAPKLAALSKKYHYPEIVFNRILDDILPKIKNSDLLPEISVTLGKKGKYSFEKLKAGDINGLFLGKMTACCQFIGGDSEKCVIDGFTKEDAGFYILRDKKGNIKAQSYAWIGVNAEGHEVLVLDSFEYLPGFNKYFIPAMKEMLSQIHDLGFADLYVGTGGKTPRLEQMERYEIEAKDKGLFRYQDSKKLYKISEKLDVAKVYKPAFVVKYKGLEELVEHNPRNSWSKIEKEAREIVATENLSGEKLGSVIYTFASNAAMFNALILKGSTTLQECMKLILQNYRDDGVVDIYSEYGADFDKDVKIWGFALQDHRAKGDFSGFAKTRGDIRCTKSDVLEFLEGGYPFSIIQLIGEYAADLPAVEVAARELPDQDINSPATVISIIPGLSAIFMGVADEEEINNGNGVVLDLSLFNPPCEVMSFVDHFEVIQIEASGAGIEAEEFMEFEG